LFSKSLGLSGVGYAWMIGQAIASVAYVVVGGVGKKLISQ